MTGTVTRVGVTDTKQFGLLLADDGAEWPFEEPLTRLAGHDRALEVGARVRFQVHARFRLAYNVEPAA